MSKKRKIRGGRNNFTILRDPSYWVLRAEIEAIKEVLTDTFLHAISASFGVKENPKSKSYKKKRDEFLKMFKRISARQHALILEELENHSPELAASLDNRALGEIEPGE